jgi:gliding motility-associated-like protein
VGNVSCFAGNNGFINTSVSGGTAPYAYNWGGGVVTPNRTGLPAGTYTVTVTDAQSCSATVSAVVTQPAAAVSVTVLSVNDVSCFGGNNGAINVSASGGTVPYNFNWGGGVTSQNRTGLAAGSYAVTVSDVNSCTSSVTAVIGQPAAALAVALSNTPVSCFGGNNATITSITTGGTAPYNYNWVGGTTTPNRTGLAAGSYSLTVTDANSCTTVNSATIAQPAALAATAVSTDVLCNGGNTGALNLSVSGGTSGYSYLWSNGSVTEDLTNLTMGNYTVTATDVNGCTIAHTAAVNEPAPLQATTITANVSCFGGTNGSVQLSVSGGVIPYMFNWSSGVNAQTVTSLQAGSYSVTVFDSHNCTTTLSVNIVEPSAILLSTSVTNVSCNNGTTGAIDLTVSGGTSGYSYNWGAGVVSEDRINLSAGLYTVTVTDANSCTVTANATITQPTAVTLSSSVTNVLCFGNATGAINLSVAGGTTPYNYNWGGGIIVEDRSNIPSGTYTVTVTDANSCSASLQSVIAQPAAQLTASVNNIVNVGCFGANSGSITMGVSGGTGPYTYLWNDGATTLNRTSITAGNYTLTVTDAVNCSVAASAAISQPSAPLSVAVSSVSNVSCFGGNNGAINILPAGGTSAYSFNWGSGITSQNRTGLNAGNYNVTVTDAASCTASVSATVTQPVAALNTSVASSTNVSCFSGNNGAISVNTNGGTSPYSYLWNDAVATEDRSGLNAGSYSLTVTDFNLCSATLSAAISQPSLLVVNIASTTNVSCYGGSNGAITTSVSGGTASYNYNWGGGITTPGRTGLSANTYTVTVNDANACSATTSATITEPSAPLQVAVASASNVSCFNAANGTIDVIATGGTPVYTYNWGAGVTSQNRTGLAAGTYSLTVSDANSCTASVSAVITQPAILQVVATATNNLCNGASTGSVNTIVTGGTTSYTYLWSNSQTTANLTAVAAGNYQVTVTDVNSCSASASAVVTQPSAISITETHYDVQCNAASTGIIDITATGGVGNFAYAWSNGDVNQDLSGLAANAYTVTVTDNNECTSSLAITIAQPAPFSISFASTNVTCNGGNDGSVNLTVSGATPGYSYQWTNGATTEDLSGVNAGNYNVIIRDMFNCVASANVTITQPNNLVVVTNTHTNVSCFGGSNGSIDISIQGGTFPFSYGWNDGVTSQDRTGLSAGTYQITVNDLNACAISQPIIITEPTAISVSLNKTDVTCNALSNGSIVSSVGGGIAPYNYSWSNGASSSSLAGVTANAYTLTVTDQNSCTISASTTVAEPTGLAVSGVKTDVACAGGASGNIDVTVTGGVAGYQYLWSNSANTEDLSSLVAGTYNVTITDVNSCQASTTFVITQPSPLSASVVAVNPICNGVSNGSIDLTVTGGVAPMSYSWNNGSITEDLSAVGAGLYSVNVTDVNGCLATASATLVMPAGIVLTETHTTPNCNSGSDGAISVSVNGGTPSYSFLWSNGAGSAVVNGLAAGSYSVTVTDANGCQASLNSISIAEPSIIGVGVVVSDVACAGGNDGAVNVSISGGTPGYFFSWSNGSVTEDLSGVIAGIYSLTVTDANGCAQTASGFVNTLPSMQINANVDQLVCAQDLGGIDLLVTSGSAPYTFNWSNGADSEDLNNITPGSYSVVVIDNNGCVIDTSFNVVNQNLFSVDATGSTTITLGETANLNAVSTGSNQTTYNWTPTFGMACSNCSFVTVQPGQTTLYTVVAVDTNGCVAQDTVVVEVIADHTVFTPNAFTPNGDGNNDVFQLFGNKAGIKYLSIMIFNRWGEKIFEGESADFSWDGTYKGEIVEPDVYVYVMKIVHLDGKNQKVFKGSLTVLR